MANGKNGNISVERTHFEGFKVKFEAVGITGPAWAFILLALIALLIIAVIASVFVACFLLSHR